MADKIDLETKAKIIRKFGTQRKFAQAAGIPECEVSNYIRGAKQWTKEHKQQAEKCLSE
jgi:hypothetical protein